MAALLLAAVGVCLGRSIEKALWTVEDRRDRRKEEKLEKLEKDMSGSNMPGVGRRRNPEMSEKERREKREKRSSVFVDPLDTNLYDHSAQLSSTHTRTPSTSTSTTTADPDPHSHLRRPRSRLSTLRNRHSLFVPSSKRHSGAFSTSGESTTTTNTSRTWTRSRSGSGSTSDDSTKRQGKRTTWHGWANLHSHAHAHGEADADALGDYVALIEEEDEFELLEMPRGDGRARRSRDSGMLRRRSVAVGGGRQWVGSCDTLVVGEGAVGVGTAPANMF